MSAEDANDTPLTTASGMSSGDARRIRQHGSLLTELQPAFRPALEGLEGKARALGDSQEDLLLSRGGQRSPFAPGQRKLLGNIVAKRLQRTRSA